MIPLHKDLPKESGRLLAGNLIPVKVLCYWFAENINPSFNAEKNGKTIH